MNIKMAKTWIILAVTFSLVACNKAPVSVISVDPPSGEIPLTVMLDGSQSYDPDGQIVQFQWDFGDGSTSNERSIYHDYERTGQYAVSLGVVDNKGKASTTHVNIAATNPTISQMGLTKLEGFLGPDNKTVVYRVDLSSASLTSISAIVIYDDSDDGDGEPGALTGADIDSVKITSALCNDAACVESAPISVPYSALLSDVVLRPGYEDEPSEYALYGTDSSGFHLDNSIATLDRFDGKGSTSSPQPYGFISLGRRGAIAFNLPNPLVPDSLCLYVGESAGNEEISVVVLYSAIWADSLLTNPRKQYYHGSCEAFAEYVESHGVTDDKGQNHPGACGRTNWYLRYSPPETTVATATMPVTVTKYKCPCNNTLYDELADCLNNCHVSLGCFTGICEPIYSEIEQICVSVASPVKMRITLSLVVSTLSWSPSGTIPSQCRQEIRRYEKDTLAHEERHVKDINDIIRSANERLQNGITFQAQACGNTEGEARYSLTDMLNARADQERLEIRQQLRERADEFDNSPEGKILLPRCDRCPGL